MFSSKKVWIVTGNDNIFPPTYNSVILFQTYMRQILSIPMGYNTVNNKLK